MKTLGSMTARLGICFGLAAILWGAASALATTLTVTNTDDNGIGSLRQAIQDAAPGDTIIFAITGTITLTSGELVVSNNLSIVGPGATDLTVMRSSVPATPEFRIFNIAGGTVTISGVTISNGRIIGAAGFGAPPGPAPGGPGSSGAAGAILNQATLSLTDCAISGNAAVGGAGGSGSSGGAGGFALGGAILSTGTLLLTNCSLAGNSANAGSGGFAYGYNFSGYGGTGGESKGGGIYLSGGTLTLANTLLSANSAGGGNGGSGSQFSGAFGARGGEAAGGGLFLETGAVTMTNSVLSGNDARAGAYGLYGASSSDGSDAAGGGIYIGNGTIVSVNTTLSGNYVLGGHAGLYALGNGGSGGYARGGGVFLNQGAAIISSSTFAGNTLTAGDGRGAGTSGSGAGSGGTALGGGFYTSFGDIKITNSTFSGNATAGGAAGVGGRNGVGSAGGAGGGGICWNGGFGVAVGCTVASNSATLGSGTLGFSALRGGGIYNLGGYTNTTSTISLLNTLVAGNSGSSNIWDLSGSFASQGFNLIGISEDGGGWVATDLRGNSATPLDPKLGPFTNNGGPTFTLALLPDSPAIDQGNGVGVTTDQRGRLRPIDNSAIPNTTDGDGSDIGAFELNPPMLSITPAAGNVVLSWPAYDTGYTLEAKTNLNPSINWSGVAGTPAIVGGQFTLTNSATTGNKSYRLRSP